MASNNKQGRSTSIVIWGTAAVVLLLAVYAVHSLTRQRVSIRTAAVSYQDITDTLPTIGKVELTDDFQVRALAPGQVEAIYVHPQQHVHKGQLLLKLSDAAALATLAHAEAALQAAQLSAANVSHGGTPEERATYDADISRADQQLQQDTMNLAGAQKLLAQGAASQAEVAAAQRRIQIDETNLQSLDARSAQHYTPADVESANAQVADANAAVAAARSALANDIITSKIDGTVYYLPVAQYDYVSADEELVDVGDLTKMRVTAYFDEADIGKLAIGQPVTMTWDGSPKPGMTWHGHVSQRPTKIKEYQNRFVGECLITVDDDNGMLDPNANVSVRVTVAQRSHVLTVPHEAVQFDAQPYVFRVVDGKLVRTNVKSGLVTVSDAEILSGLSEGDIIATNAAELRNRESVTVVPGP